MACSQSFTKGQFPVSCDLCETETKIQWKCINCELLMCDKCKTKIHPKFKFAKDHKIIDIKEVGLHSEEVDLSHISCKDHAGQTCFMFCKSCDQLVCPLCIANIHNGHGLVEIREGYQIQVDGLKQGQNQAKINLKELDKTESKLIEIRKVENTRYLEAKKQIQEQNAALKREVDDHTGKLMKDLDQNWEILNSSIDKEECQVLPIKKSMSEQTTAAEDLINSRNAEKVFVERKKLEQSLRVTIKPPQLNFKTMPTFLPGKITLYNIGSLQEESADIEIKFLKQFTTGISRVYYMTTFVDDSMWISDGETLQRVRAEGNNLKVLSTFNITIFSMALTPNNELFLTKGSVLNTIDETSGKLTDTVYNVDPLRLTAVHVTRDFKVIVGVKNIGKAFPVSGRRAVIVMDTDGNHETLYENDPKNHQQIFAYVACISSSKNGNIAVVDEMMDNYKGRVVILGQEGVLNTYDGHSTVNTEDKPFKPTTVTNTPSDNFIVPELDLHIIHIINQSGNFITSINTRDNGISFPFTFVFPSTGKAYIGCTRAKGSTDNAKLCEVNVHRL